VAVTSTSATEPNQGFGNGHGNGNGNGNGGNPNGNGGGNQNGHGDGHDGVRPPTTEAPTPPSGKKVEIEGLISAIAGAVLIVNGQNVLVPATVIVHHGSHLLDFAELQVGDRVHIRANLIADVLTAREVKLQNPGDQNIDDDDDDDGGDDEELLIDGLVSQLGNDLACPTKAFTMGSTRIHANAATVYIGITCATLANGTHVKVTGVIQPDTSFVATKIERVP
jgi:hypothetical protein